MTVNNKVTRINTFVTLHKKGVLILRILDKVSELLKQQNKKQIDLTNYLGVSKNVFTDWKSGRNKSYRKYIPQIAEFFNVSADYILGTEQQNPSLTDEQRELIEAYKAASPELQAAALAILRLKEGK